MTAQQGVTMSRSPDPTDIHIGARVRMRRMMLGMSQTELGDALGVTFQQVQKYEKGKNRIGGSRLQQIASILQVPITFFFEGNNAAPGAATIGEGAVSPTCANEFLTSSEGVAIITAFGKIADPKVRRLVANLVKLVAETQDAQPKQRAA